MPELAEGLAAGVLRLPDELLLDEPLLDDPLPELLPAEPEVLAADDPPELVPDDVADCALPVFWAEAEMTALAAPGRV